MIKKLCKWDDNLLSFLCGILSNIPISLFFAVTDWGENWLEHAYLLVWIFAFIVSVFLTVSAFSFTICKINIQKKIDSVDGLDAKEKQLDLLLEDKKIKTRLRCSLSWFLVLAVVLIAALITIWVLANL